MLCALCLALAPSWFLELELELEHHWNLELLLVLASCILQSSMITISDYNRSFAPVTLFATLCTSTTWGTGLSSNVPSSSLLGSWVSVRCEQTNKLFLVCDGAASAT